MCQKCDCQLYNAEVACALGFAQIEKPVNNQQVVGRVSYFIAKGRVIMKDQWVLCMLQGFREEP